jgi:hypothetical protein
VTPGLIGGCAALVQFTTDENNQASRSAILRLGARQESIVRHERIMPDGRKRNCVRFSIIDEEWPGVRELLLRKLASRQTTIHHPAGTN